MWYNSLMAWLLRSPLHGLLSKNTLLITVHGRKSGRPYTMPVNYAREGEMLGIISKRERTWWRNVRGGAPVHLRLAGRDVNGYAEAVEEEGEVIAHLPVYLRQIPLAARSLGIEARKGELEPAGLASAARDWLLIRLTLA